MQLEILFAVFFFALGACVGSFLNVVIWRLPNRGREVIFQKQRGRMTLSWPPSHCPVCDSPIRWYQNIPVISWMALRGHCAVCRTDIPVRYPLVELGTALLFAVFYLAYFVAHWQSGFTDVREPAQGAAFVLHLAFISALLAASAIDADLFIIPLSITILLMILGLAGATFIDHPAIWAVNLKDYPWAGRPILGAAFGLIVANILLITKILPRSFAAEDVELHRLEAQAKSAAKKEKNGKTPPPPKEHEREEPLAPPPKLTKFGPSAIACIVLILIAIAAWTFLTPKTATLIIIIAGIAIFFIGVFPRDAGQTDVTDEVMDEISSPFARREILKELLFLFIPAAFAALAYLLPFDLPQTAWMARLLGSLLGLLGGGALVWLIRILGTLLFNKEAMGMGDAHLMAGVGAIIGFPLVFFAFFTAPFIAIVWAVVLWIGRKPNVLPYGPWLSVASILSLLIGDPVMAWYAKHFL